MSTNINGVEVIFPFKPYNIQLDYMGAVIKCLQNKQNGILESPTGTGKTLSLLCSTLAWLNSRKYQDLDLVEDVPNMKNYASFDTVDDEKIDELNPKKQKANGGKAWKKETPIRIIYSSRTHSQLNQACAELKRCYYKFTPSITIGSRDQLCINNEVKKLETVSAKNQSCRMKVKNNACSYHHNYEKTVSDLSLSGTFVYDIEDMVSFGNAHKACPYYLAKAKADFNTSLLFMPYNYIIDPNIRRTLRINLENAVIIFDEGHNIERVCEDSMSTELRSDWIATFVETFNNVLLSLNQFESGSYSGSNSDELSELNAHDVAIVKMAICDLEKELQELVQKNSKIDQSKTPCNPDEIFKVFERAGLDVAKSDLIRGVCDKLIAYVMSSETAYMSNIATTAITSICNFFEIVMPLGNENGRPNNLRAQFVSNYKIYTKYENENNFSSNSRSSWVKKKSADVWTVHLLCMSPSVAIKSLMNMGVYNLIITSGTLSPLESFECEMGISFPVKLQNNHVIDRNQLSVQLISKDPNGFDLSGSYENRKGEKYYHAIGNTILELSRIIPKGIFIFFSSYWLIKESIQTWEKSYIWNALNNQKSVFVEPRNKTEFPECMLKYKQAVDGKLSGAIFIGVSRGKLSEGIDLGDDYCRAVIVVGLPYPAAHDFKVRLKEKYLDEMKSKLNGQQWYILQMKRALNQSIGRVVRHRNDYGSIIICDSRFTKIDGLSKWIQAFIRDTLHFQLNGDFRSKMKQIQSFFGQKNLIPVNINSQNENSSTSSGKERDNSFSSSQSSQNSEENDLVLSTFASIKNSQIITKNSSSYSKDNNGSSIRNVFGSIGSNKKRNFEQTLSPKKTVLSSKSSITDYFRKQHITDSKMESPKPKLNSPEVIDLEKENDFEVSSQASTQKIDLENIFEIKEITDLFKTNQDTLRTIVDEIKGSSFKHKQFVETFRVYSKRKNAIYLALRLNFILDEIELNKRNNILNDLSKILPNNERNIFLTTCKVKV
ncbi:hypothetical protein RDWZM_007782 [Blomia tropicalis]|uniref:Regulator of telomere elongation helicase 1 homolog n=1 Tax=Blomia tropicalis TaxID=40697 RepID=A0A9Q0RJR4_BLOTA|nr:hypothetical protein RDWZM_007782 [Blomia tropicalis]